MIERIIPRNRPDDDTLGARMPEQAENKEQIEKNFREHLELRLFFAEAVSEKKEIPVEEAMRDYTDLHVRLTGKWPGQSDEADHLWQGFISQVQSVSGHEERLEVITRFSEQHPIESEHEQRRFDPFDFKYSEADHAVDIHFGTLRPEASDPNEPGILSHERLPEMRQILKEMFTYIKEQHPDAEIVRGGSWLYNREAYRRLYPASYTANPRIRRGKFTGGGTWGQFRDKTGAVDKVAKAKFLQNLPDIDLENLEDVFPNKTLMVSAPISEFYKEYGIE